MHAHAVILEGPQALRVDSVALAEPGPADVVVQMRHSGISTGTEKLFWTGEMPPFPGMGYPLVPGYEATGDVVEAGPEASLRTGDTVFVPGADCYGDIRGLFGGASSLVVTPSDRAVRIDQQMGAEGALLALAATARHAMAGLNRVLPDLIVGHGVFGRLLARMTLAAGGQPPTVWEIDPNRAKGARGYPVLHPDRDPRRDYGCIYDATGDSAVLDQLIGRLARGGEIVLAGFYPDRVGFAFPPAFMKEARFRVAAEWTRDDLVATRDLVDHGALSLADLITHRCPAEVAPVAYPQAFTDPNCLKMILDWGAPA